MKHLILLLLAIAATPSLRAAATVTNVRAAQIPGKHQVRITYDLAAAATCTVSVQATKDGAAVSVPPAAYQGDGVGASVSPGTGKSITLTVESPDNPVKVTALQDTYTKNLRFKILAMENTTGPAPEGFALIPAGSFTMGQDGIATPVHSVYVSAFYMAKYETTKELWDSVRTWGLSNGYTDLAAGGNKGANHPVHSITWYDMVKWCNARSEMENLVPCYTASGEIYRMGQSTPDCNWNSGGYRLPSEAEWEKAARGGQAGLIFPWGNTITHSQANYFSSGYSSGDVSPTQGYHPIWSNNDDHNYPYTSPVGSFAAELNYGVYDMLGNVWEWCWDWHGSYASGSQTDTHGATWGSARVFRGGGWFNPQGATFCNVAFRNNYYGPGASAADLGFRSSRSLIP